MIGNIKQNDTILLFGIIIYTDKSLPFQTQSTGSSEFSQDISYQQLLGNQFNDTIRSAMKVFASKLKKPLRCDIAILNPTTYRTMMYSRL